MIYKIKSSIIIFLFFIVSSISYGADPGPPDPPPCPGGGDPVVGPIENGVPIILGLALVYGAFKLQQVRRKLKEKENKI